jgi:hypothetical protein
MSFLPLPCTVAGSLQVLKSKAFPYQSVLDLPFRSFHIVIGSHEHRNLAEEVDWYNQVRVRF